MDFEALQFQYSIINLTLHHLQRSKMASQCSDALYCTILILCTVLLLYFCYPGGDRTPSASHQNSCCNLQLDAFFIRQFHNQQLKASDAFFNFQENIHCLGLYMRCSYSILGSQYLSSLLNSLCLESIVLDFASTWLITLIFHHSTLKVSSLICGLKAQ